MVALAQITAGARVTAAMLRSAAPLSSYKAMSQPVTSSTTFINDSALFVPVAANAVYIFELFAAYSGGTQGASDIKMQWAFPAGCSFLWTQSYLNTSGVEIANGTNGPAGVVTAGTSPGNGRAVTGYGSLVVGSTPGDFQLQWAQNQPNATPTMLLAGSFIALWQLQ